MRKKAILKSCALKLVLVTILASLFLGIIAPLLFTFVIPPIFVHKGISFYKEESYLKYENGEAFRSYLDSLEFVHDGEIVDFYHVNHLLRDSLFYGKYWDVFSVDVQISDEEYGQIKEEISKNNAYIEENSIGDYELYALHELPFSYVLAFCDADSIIRCVMLADLTQKPKLWNCFVMYTELQWEKKEDDFARTF